MPATVKSAAACSLPLPQAENFSEIGTAFEQHAAPVATLSESTADRRNRIQSDTCKGKSNKMSMNLTSHMKKSAMLSLAHSTHFLDDMLENVRKYAYEIVPDSIVKCNKAGLNVFTNKLYFRDILFSKKLFLLVH